MTDPGATLDAVLLDEAIAEIARLQKIADDWAALSQDDGKKDREIDRLRADFSTESCLREDWKRRAHAAEARVKELEQDAARYRWHADAAPAPVASAAPADTEALCARLDEEAARHKLRHITLSHEAAAMIRSQARELAELRAALAGEKP